MKNKIALKSFFALAIIVGLSVSAHIGYASEVTGNISSSSVTNTQSTNGFISGTVSGTTTQSSGGGGSSSRGGGSSTGGDIGSPSGSTVTTTTVSSSGAPIFLAGTVARPSSRVAASTPSETEVSTETNTQVVEVVETTTTTPEPPSPSNPSDQLVASVGALDGISLGTWLWILLLVLLLIIGVTYFYNKPTKRNTSSS